jgi:tRNA(Ile2) C34 agmatinyltransferase TiaS
VQIVLWSVLIAAVVGGLVALVMALFVVREPVCPVCKNKPAVGWHCRRCGRWHPAR